MNACAHHNISHIGILGVDKKGQEFYQVMLGGSSGDVSKAAVGKVLGPAFCAADIPAAVETILEHYVAERFEGERFVELVQRIGLASFKRVLYPEKKGAALSSLETVKTETLGAAL
jgi:sulfite reductase (NADPH) hemoprotein beta-component